MKEQSATELTVVSWFWSTLQHCGQLQKFCGTMPDQYIIASGHIYDMQFDLHQNLDWFMRCEQHKVAEKGDFDPKIGFHGRPRPI